MPPSWLGEGHKEQGTGSLKKTVWRPQEVAQQDRGAQGQGWYEGIIWKIWKT